VCRILATENEHLQIQKDTQGVQTVYKLTDDALDEALGEAVVSEYESEIRLHGIFVKPEHRGKGCARSLMEAVLSLDETKTVTLCTGLGNIAFFKLFGFQVTGIGESLVTMQKRP
jgi:GNAT superfamily N-acetyltransferase